MRILIGIIGLIICSCAFSDYFSILSPDFRDRGLIPNVFSCEGKNISPELFWENPPRNTQSYALIINSPDSGVQNMFYNWVLYNIEPSTKRLKKGANLSLPDGTLVGTNTMGDAIYRGPCPPDDLLHHYIFTIYALDSMLDLSPGADVEEVYRKINNHILDQAQITGVFHY